MSRKIVFEREPYRIVKAPHTNREDHYWLEYKGKDAMGQTTWRPIAQADWSGAGSTTCPENEVVTHFVSFLKTIAEAAEKSPPSATYPTKDKSERA